MAAAGLRPRAELKVIAGDINLTERDANQLLELIREASKSLSKGASRLPAADRSQLRAIALAMEDQERWSAALRTTNDPALQLKLAEARSKASASIKRHLESLRMTRQAGNAGGTAAARKETEKAAGGFTGCI